MHEAYAYALDLIYAVAASFGMTAGTAVFVFVRPRRTVPAAASGQARSLVETAGQTQ